MGYEQSQLSGGFFVCKCYTRDDMTQKETYEEFRERVLGTAYEIWHDGGPYTGTLLAMQGAEKEHAFAMLLQGLRQGDYAVVEALGVLDAERALPEIKKIFPGAEAMLRVELVRFLLDHDPQVNLEECTDMLLSTFTNPGSCLSAVITLRRTPTKTAKDALLEMVEKNPEYLVRYHAADSLLHIANSSLDAHPEVLANINGDGLAPEDFSRFSEARKQLSMLLSM